MKHSVTRYRITLHVYAASLAETRKPKLRRNDVAPNSSIRDVLGDDW